ncbi:glutathione hydrolase 1 proenzyme-like [Paramisgurnus dabryanus]|uniref:glutathione hydrolase 1 proenzyme-like n=1 Tax=Paramisgurnus dabryanus TaxID=90735 RepID=UPI0031F35D3E
MGIGGGVVFTIYNAFTEKVEVIDARETAPKNVSANMFDKDPKKAVSGGLSIGVPGFIRGIEMAHNRHGRLKWSELFEPSIKLAREGVKVGKALAEAIQYNISITDDQTLYNFFNNTKLNDMIKFPELADTYETISKHGPDAFYNGSLTKNIVKDIQRAGGNITFEDLQGYKARNEYPLNFTVGNYTFHVPTVPFGGPVLALILNILSVGKCRHFPKAYFMQFVNLVLQYVKNMISKEFADEIRNKINDSTTSSNSASSLLEDSGTSHLSIIAEDGSAVAVTSTINNFFGSKMMSNSTGIIFNNQMHDFSNSTSIYNSIEPGIRPMSSMCPTIIMDQIHKRVKMVVGASGGKRITTATALVILNHLFFDYELDKAVNETRIFNEWETNVTETVEVDFPKPVIEGLKKKNHIIRVMNLTSVVQATVRMDNGSLCAKCDDRKGGFPAGY